MSKIVRDVMAPEPWTIDATASIEQAAHLMRAWDLREVLVVDQGELTGLLTDSDISVLAITAGRPPSTILAGESCNPAAPRLNAHEPISEALDYMRRHNLRHVPVVDHDNHLVGAVWITDLATATTSKHAPHLSRSG